jgi:hypothetical protein
MFYRLIKKKCDELTYPAFFELKCAEITAKSMI